jgi:hypothetical protein
LVFPNGRPRFAGVPPPLPPDLPVCFCMARVLELGASRADRERVSGVAGAGSSGSVGWAPHEAEAGRQAGPQDCADGGD